MGQCPPFQLSPSYSPDISRTSISDSLPALFKDSLPACAWVCVLANLQQNFAPFCSDISDLDCICSHYGVTGYTLGETILGCLHSTSCGTDALRDANSLYGICVGRANAATPTHSIITIQPSATSTVSTASKGSLSGITSSTRPTITMAIGSSTPSMTSTSKTPQSTSATSLPAQQSNPVPLTTAQIAGISIASIALLVVIIAVGMCFLCLRRQNKRIKGEDSKSYYPEPKTSPSTYSHRRFSINPRIRVGGRRFSSFDRAPASESQRWPRYYRVSPPPTGVVFPSAAQQMQNVRHTNRTTLVPPAREHTPWPSASPKQTSPSSSSDRTVQYAPPPPAVRGSQRASRMQSYYQQHLIRGQQMAMHRSSATLNATEPQYGPASVMLTRPAHLKIQIPNLPSQPPQLNMFPPATQELERSEEVPRTPPLQTKRSKKAMLDVISQAALGNSENERVIQQHPSKQQLRQSPSDVYRESTTSIESNGNGSDDDHCTDEEDGESTATVKASPISNLRYPKVPRPSNSRSSTHLRVRISGSSLYSTPTSPGKTHGPGVPPSPSTTPSRSPGRSDASKPSQYSPTLRSHTSPGSTASPNMSSPSSGYHGVEDRLWKTEISPGTGEQLPYPSSINAAHPYYTHSHVQYVSQTSPRAQTPQPAAENDAPVPQYATWQVDSENGRGKPLASPFGLTPTLTPTKRGDDLYLSVQR